MPDNWYVQSGGQQLGPMPLESVQRMKAEGKLQSADFIWAEGWAQWQPVGEVAELGGSGDALRVDMGATESGAVGAFGAGAVASGRAPGVAGAASATSETSPLLYQPAQSRWQAAPALEYRGAPNHPVVATEGAIQALASTRPWVMLWAVLLFIGAAFSVLGVLGMLVVGVADRDGDFLRFAIVFGLIYLLIGVFYFFAGLYLTKYFAAIGRTNRLRRSEDLESALRQQFRFWRLTGIALATIIVAYLVIFVGAMAFGLLS